jgi:hypothetical protein
MLLALNSLSLINEAIRFLGTLTCLICTHHPLNSNLRDDGYRSDNVCASIYIRMRLNLFNFFYQILVHIILSAIFLIILLNL